jgi:hypothetical protein
LLFAYLQTVEDGYEFTISREQYDKQPTIHIGPQELPISPGTAAKIAFDAIKPLLPPDQFSRLRCGDIQIHQIPNPDTGNLAVNTKRWYYHVSFRTDAGETFMTPSILYDRVLVLMDGSPVLLKKKNG